MLTRSRYLAIFGLVISLILFAFQPEVAVILMTLSLFLLGGILTSSLPALFYDIFYKNSQYQFIFFKIWLIFAFCVLFYRLVKRRFIR
jgi:hypothetical protein